MIGNFQSSLKKLVGMNFFENILGENNLCDKKRHSLKLQFEHCSFIGKK